MRTDVVTTRVRPGPVGAALLLSAVAIAGCGSDDGDDDPAARAQAASAVLIYDFHDASVPPEYHRSYSVTASDGTVRIVVDSYGDILHDEETSLDESTFQAVLDEIDALEVSGASDDEGCTGGTSSELTVTDADADADADDVGVTSISASSCGDGEPDTQQLSELVAPLLADFDMAALLAPSE